MRLLIVDDDRDLIDLLTFALQRAGFEVLSAPDPPAATRLIEAEQPDLIVLDINLRGWSGLDLLRDLRRTSAVPVILLSARTTEDDKVNGFELGADDYLTKPFSHRELIARIRAQFRRRDAQWQPPQAAAVEYRAGGIVLNAAEHSVTKDGQPLSLSVTEFRLLQYLMANAGSVVPTGHVLRQVWGYDDPSGSDVVRVTIFRLRRKLEDDPSHPTLLHTISGVGFLLKPGPVFGASVEADIDEQESSGGTNQTG